MAIGGDDRLAGREAMLGQQFGDGAVGGALLPQFQDDLPCRGQFLEPWRTPRCEARDCGEDRARIKRGHGANFGEAIPRTNSGISRDMSRHSRWANARIFPALSWTASQTLRGYSWDTVLARLQSSSPPIPGLIEDPSADVDSPRPRTIRGQTHGQNAAVARTRSRTDRVQVRGYSMSTPRLSRDCFADTKPYGIVGVGRLLCSKDGFRGSCHSLSSSNRGVLGTREFLPMSWSAIGQPFRRRCLPSGDGNRGRIPEPKSCCLFLGGKLARRFNHRAQWPAITCHRVVTRLEDSPQLLPHGSGDRCILVHGETSPCRRIASVYVIHKIPARSGQCPRRGHRKDAV